MCQTPEDGWFSPRIVSFFKILPANLGFQQETYGIPMDLSQYNIVWGYDQQVHKVYSV